MATWMLSGSGKHHALKRAKALCCFVGSPSDVDSGRETPKEGGESTRAVKWDCGVHARADTRMAPNIELVVLLWLRCRWKYTRETTRKVALIGRVFVMIVVAVVVVVVVAEEVEIYPWDNTNSCIYWTCACCDCCCGCCCCCWCCGCCGCGGGGNILVRQHE